jgi:SWIM zinc finger
MSEWTLQRVEQLAPDSASSKAAQGLAKPAKWQGLGQAGNVIWGECQGSGANPYQVRVDIADVAYKCSCPSRKLPCKHSLGLLMLLVGGSVATGTPPAFVQEWIDNRAKRAENKIAKENQPPAPVDEKEQKKRIAKRESRVELGLDLLETALSDLVSQGLAAARSQPPSYWTQLASRLVDTQTPGLARRVRALGDLFVGRSDWQDATLFEMSRLQLLIDAYRNLSLLPVELATDVRSAIGWTHDQKELLASQGIRDQWRVVGREQDEEESIRVQRTWLLGTKSKRAALLLDFAPGNQPFPASMMMGQCIDAELVFFASATPLRALVKERHAAVELSNQLHIGSDIAELQNTFAKQLSSNPWIERWPALVGPVFVAPTSAAAVHLIDAGKRTIPLVSSSKHAMHLVALSGGTPINIVGTWDGHALRPLSAFANGHHYSIGTIESLAILPKVA